MKAGLPFLGIGFRDSLPHQDCFSLAAVAFGTIYFRSANELSLKGQNAQVSVNRPRNPVHNGRR
jgi:hypothetical protein